MFTKLAMTYMPIKAQRTHLHTAGIPIRIWRRHRDIFKKIISERRESGIPRISPFYRQGCVGRTDGFNVLLRYRNGPAGFR